MLGLTKVEKKYIQLNVKPDVIVPKGGLTWEQRVMRDELEGEMRLRRERPKAEITLKIYSCSVRQKKAKQEKHEIQIGCIRPGFTFYKTLVWYT